MEIEPLFVDFGDVSVGDDVRREIVIRNTGRSPLEIEQVRLSCASCLVVHSYPREPIMPGGQGMLEFSLDFSKGQGNIQTAVLIVSNGVDSMNTQRITVVDVRADILTDGR